MSQANCYCNCDRSLSRTHSTSLSPRWSATFKAKCAMFTALTWGQIGLRSRVQPRAPRDCHFITTGRSQKAPHKKPIAGVSAEDAKAVADYIKA